MNKKLKLRLKNALKKAGLSEGLADKMNDWDDEEIKSYITTLESNANDGDDDDDEVDIEALIGSDEFEEWVEENGFDKLMQKSKAIQSGNDRKVGQALNTVKGKLTGKKGKEDDDDDDGAVATDGMPDWFKPFAKQLGKLNKEQQQGTKLEQAKEAMKASKLPPQLQKKWLGRLDLDSDVEFEDQVSELETEYDTVFGGVDLPDADDDAGGSGDSNYRVPSSRKKKTEKGDLSKEDEKSIEEAAKSFSMNQ